MCRLWIFAALLVPLAASAADAPLRFSLGSGEPPAGFTKVAPGEVYLAENGFGFEPEAAVEAAAGFVTGSKPFSFSAKLPEGNYRITVTLGDPAGEARTTVKAELRRLMLENVATKNETATRSFIVNVRTPQIAGGSEVKLKDRERTAEWRAWDEKLTLEFSGSRPCVGRIEIERADVPTLYLLGDSTVCDQPAEPFASWGQMLPRFFKPQIAIANHAESGESLRSSLGARRLDKVLSTIKSGDWLFIQYGHNDMKAVDAAVYKADLKRFVSAARDKGGQVVLITPMHRRTFTDGKITNSHRDFPDAVRAAAAEEKAPLIDLHAMSQTLYEAWGPDKSILAFSTPRDGTHHNNYGAYELAKCVALGIQRNKLDLARFMEDDARTFDPSRPDPIERLSLLSPGP